MAQPIKKKIQETHPDLIKKQPYKTLIIDGGSLLFHCMRDESVNSIGVHYGGVFQFLLQVKMMLSKGDFDYVYCFFDNEYSGLLRWQLYHQYKANRDKHYEQYGGSDYWKEYMANLKNMQKYIFGKNKPKVKKEKNNWEKFIDANFDRERDILCKYFEELYIRWYMDDIVEGDDLISYYCNNKEENEKIIIITGDMDLMQLLSEDIAIYNLQNKKFITVYNFEHYYGYYYGNTLVKKVFCGDVSDNIGNIKGLSEDGFYKLMPEAKNRLVTVDEVKDRAKKLISERIENKKKPYKLHENIVNGVSNKEYDGDFYEINEKIINLKKPLISDEAKDVMDSMMHTPIDPDNRSFKNLYSYILEDGIDELNGDTRFASFFSVFKKLEEKEKKRYEEYLKTK